MTRHRAGARANPTPQTITTAISIGYRSSSASRLDREALWSGFVVVISFRGRNLCGRGAIFPTWDPCLRGSCPKRDASSRQRSAGSPFRRTKISGGAVSNRCAMRRPPLSTRSLSWIEHRSTEPRVGSSNLPGEAKAKSQQVLGFSVFLGRKWSTDEAFPVSPMRGRCAGRLRLVNRRRFNRPRFRGREIDSGHSSQVLLAP